MPLHMIRGNIAAVRCDAIVNAANNSLLCSDSTGGINGAIHHAAGPELLEECRTLNGCATGEAKITKGYRLPCKYVIHTAGPLWQGGNAGETELLERCYRNSLQLAEQYHCETLAFPLISAGAKGYPKQEAQALAIRTISQFLTEHEMTVFLVLNSAPEGRRYSAELDQWVTGNLRPFPPSGILPVLAEEAFLASEDKPMPPAPASAPMSARKADSSAKEKKSLLSRFKKRSSPAKETACEEAQPLHCSASFEMEHSSLASILRSPDESFSQMLLRLIDEKGMKDSECYKKANIDRKLFSKIRSDIHYKPKKVTVLAFAIALELSLEDTQNMLQTAGYALSHCTAFDLIVEYFIRRGNYNIYEINEALFEYDQIQIGA